MTKNIKIIVKKSLVLLLGGLVSCTPKVKSTTKLPNIVIICTDDMGWSDIGCYGSEIETPNLDYLAENGMRFTQFHNTAKCFRSKTSLLTGLYSQDCGFAKTYKNPLQNAVTIGEVLHEVNYLTYFAGKHYAKYNPYDRGFDHFFGLKDGACNHFNPGSQREGEGKPAQKRNNRGWGIDDKTYIPYTPEEKDFYDTDYYTNYALKYIEEAHQKEKPFLLFLAYNAPHEPLMAWPEDIAKYKGKYDEGYEAIRKRRYEKQLNMGLIDSTYKLSNPTYQPWASLSKEEKVFEANKMEVYAAMIDRVDQNIGRLLDKLREYKMDDNTLILFMTDNGASDELTNLKDDNDDAPIGSMERWVSIGGNWANVANTPFRFGKSYSYEGGTNTPLIACWPGRIRTHSFSNFTGHLIDIMPTLVEITHAKYPETFNGETIVPMAGQSLLPAFNGEIPEREKPIYWSWGDGKALRKDQWKIVLNDTTQWDLYNLKDDPSETKNLASDLPEKVKELDSLYQAWSSKYSD